MAVDFDEIPQDMVNALVAAEDTNYFDHAGVDPRGLARAAVELVSSGGSIQSGGSTITMQVARNYMLTLDQTFTRKIREILLALQMEQVLSKEEIFELYVNKIFLGNRAYGIAAASETYYDKPLAELTLAQTAMIAGLSQSALCVQPSGEFRTLAYSTQLDSLSHARVRLYRREHLSIVGSGSGDCPPSLHANRS